MDILTTTAFQELFFQEKTCSQLLWDLKELGGLECATCHERDFYELAKDLTVRQCKHCGRQETVRNATRLAGQRVSLVNVFKSLIYVVSRNGKCSIKEMALMSGLKSMVTARKIKAWVEVGIEAQATDTANSAFPPLINLGCIFFDKPNELQMNHVSVLATDSFDQRDSPLMDLSRGLVTLWEKNYASLEGAMSDQSDPRYRTLAACIDLMQQELVDIWGICLVTIADHMNAFKHHVSKKSKDTSTQSVKNIADWARKVHANSRSAGWNLITNVLDGQHFAEEFNPIRKLKEPEPEYVWLYLKAVSRIVELRDAPENLGKIARRRFRKIPLQQAVKNPRRGRLAAGLHERQILTVKRRSVLGLTKHSCRLFETSGYHHIPEEVLEEVAVVFAREIVCEVQYLLLRRHMGGLDGAALEDYWRLNLDEFRKYMQKRRLELYNAVALKQGYPSKD